MFIGERKIKNVSDDGDYKILNFEGEPPARVHKELYEKIATEKKGNGNIQDVIYHYIATKFLAELAYYGLEFYAAEGVGTSLQVLAHNLREEAIAKKFDCKSPYNIKIQDIV